MADGSSDNIYYGSSTDDEEEEEVEDVSHKKLAGVSNESELEGGSQSVIAESPEIGRVRRKGIRIVVSDSDESDEEQEQGSGDSAVVLGPSPPSSFPRENVSGDNRMKAAVEGNYSQKTTLLMGAEQSEDDALVVAYSGMQIKDNLSPEPSKSEVSDIERQEKNCVSSNVLESLASVSGEGADVLKNSAALDSKSRSKMVEVHNSNSSVNEDLQETLPVEEDPAEVSDPSVPSTEPSSVPLRQNLKSPGPQVEHSFFTSLPTGTSTPISISSGKSKMEIMNESSSSGSKMVERKQPFVRTLTVEDDSGEINHVSDVQTASNNGAVSSEDSGSGSGHSETTSVLSKMRQLSLHKTRKDSPSVVEVSSGSDGSDWSVECIGIKRNTKKAYVESSESVESESSSSDDDEEEEAGSKRRAKEKPPQPPRGAKFLEFDELPPPSARVTSSTNVYYATQFNGDVHKMIHKLAKIIETMPVEGEGERDKDFTPPQRLIVTMFEHQKFGLEWLYWRERNYPGGGILADEMGLGKTIMMISLICKSIDDKKLGINRETPEWVSTRFCDELVPSSATLVICPASVLNQWIEEVEKRARNLRVLSYYGQRRPTSSSVIAQYNVVVTTYTTVINEISSPLEDPRNRDRRRSPLLRLNWERLILDEGHTIRNSKTHTALAIGRLTSTYKWIVTGTPVHNKPGDMYSLVKFLRLEPFDDPKVWDYWIGMKSVKKTNADRLQVITKSLLLRRTKTEVQERGTLAQKIPEKTIMDVNIQLTEEESQVHEHLYTFAKEEFRKYLKNKAEDDFQRAADQYVAGGRRGQGSGNKHQAMMFIFTLMLRLRQSTVLPHLIHDMLQDDSDEDPSEEYNPETHDITSKRNPIFRKSFKSTKIRQLLNDIDDIRDANEHGAMEKIVIVSQWTTLLDIIEHHLVRRRYKIVKINGKTNVADRATIATAFNTNPKSPQILLLSLTAGGVGLNLVGANHMFIMDLHYNPQLELQAHDRLHRFGQTRPVQIKRYVANGTFDDKMLQFHKTKLELASQVLSSSKKAGGNGLSLQELKMLFDM